MKSVPAASSDPSQEQIDERASSRDPRALARDLYGRLGIYWQDLGDLEHSEITSGLMQRATEQLKGKLY
jgi:hypothetical protein